MVPRCLAAALMAVGLCGATARSQEDAAPANPPAALRRIERHKDWAWAVGISPDEWRLLSCSGGPDRTARVWDFATGNELRRIDVPGGLYDALWLPDGRHALLAGASGLITVWDTRENGVAGHLHGHPEAVRTLAVSRDGRLAASGSEDGTARVWNLDKRIETLKFEVSLDEPVYDVAFSPDGRLLVTGDGEGMIRLWDLVNGREAGRLEGHTEAVWSVAFLPDGHHVVSGSADKTVRLWDTAEGRERLRYEGAGKHVYDVELSPDGRRLAAATAGLTVPIWDVVSGRILHTIDVKTGGTLDLAFSADGSRLVGGCGDGTIWVATLPDQFPGETPRPQASTKARRKGR